MWWFSISCTLSDLKFMLCMGLYFCVIRACFHIHWLVVVPFFCMFMSGYYNGYSCLIIILPCMHDYHKHVLVHAFLPCANSIYNWWW